MSQGMAVERDNTGEIRNQSTNGNCWQWLLRFPNSLPAAIVGTSSFPGQSGRSLEGQQNKELTMILG
jgi:hypothetical protein